MKQFTDKMGALIADKISGFQFKKREHRLFRSTENGWQAITLEVLPTASHGFGKLAAHAQVRHEQIESFYAPYHPFMKPEDAKVHATLTVNCDTLLKHKALAHGFSLDPASLNTFAEAYAEAIKSDVIPWLAKFAKEEALFAGLADSDPRKWVTSDRLTRFPVLMAILARRGDAEGFDSIATEFQEWCMQKHAAVYAPLAASMLRLRPVRENMNPRANPAPGKPAPM